MGLLQVGSPPNSPRPLQEAEPSVILNPYHLELLHLQVMLHQEATNVPDADGAVQVLLLQEQLTLFDGLLRVLTVHPAESTDSLSPNLGRGWGVRGQSRPSVPQRLELSGTMGRNFFLCVSSLTMRRN